MLKGRGRDPRVLTSPPPATHSAMRPPALSRPPAHTPQRVTLARPEPDYEVVEFPGEQYVNAKLQPPPPPPPRPPTGHPPDAGASCGLCGGGGARVRCAECGRRALCASCDDMYHRHPKRRHHQRQALSQSQLRDDRPPLPPKVAPPVPPPRRHKIGGDRMSASPKPPMLDQRRATLGHMGVMMGPHGQATASPTNHMPPQHGHQQIPLHLQAKITTTPTPNHIGSMPFLPTNVHHPMAPVAQTQVQSNTLSHMSASPWNRQRGSLQGFNMHPNMAVPTESWESPETMGHSVQNWGRPLRRGASVLELGGGAAAGCAHCAPAPAAWRYGSCASLDHGWPGAGAGAWPPAPAPACCAAPHAPHNAHMHPHSHMHPPQTPQPYRRAESRAASRAASRAGSRAGSPAMSVRSRTSRRTKHRTPSPPPLPSSDADSESEDSDRGPAVNPQAKEENDSLGPVPPPPSSTWQCEHCTFVNEPGVRVCVVCCRTPTTAPKTITMDEINDKVERLKITQKETPSPARVSEEPRVERSAEKSSAKQKKERTSTGCGPSPPRDGNKSKKPINRLVTPTREQTIDQSEKSRERHDMAVGPSPPREAQNDKHADMSTEMSPPRDVSRTVRVSPYRDIRESPRPEPPKRHSISVGPSPPRESAHTAGSTAPKISITNIQKKSTGTSPPRETIIESRTSMISSKTNVSNTGTSPPPQSISTQTYEVPDTWERAPSVTRSRPRRRFRGDSRRERSHSRHSLSSDTRESDRSVRTAGGGRWQWRERDSSPDNYSRLSRRASHLDLRRTRSNRRSSYYGSEAASPERQSTTRAISLEALAGAGAKREAERGMELAQLLSEAERLGFSAAEVQAALAQSPAAPLAWLRERWPSLCAGVRAAAARLAPAAAPGELQARAALARHRGAMWPAVTECVERCRRQAEARAVGPEGRLRGRVWGSPAGADDDAAPPRSPRTPPRRSPRPRAEDSSDEFEVPTPSKFRDDDWMYLPLDVNIDDVHPTEPNDPWNDNSIVDVNDSAEDLAKKLKALLTQAGVPSIDENLLLKGLMSGNMVLESGKQNSHTNHKPQLIDLIPSENDFIDAYNALTRSSPLPNINDALNNISVMKDENEPPKNTSISALEKSRKVHQTTKNDELLNATALNDEEPQHRTRSHHKSKTELQSSHIEPQDNIHFIDEHIEQASLNANNILPNQIELQTKTSNITKSEENLEERPSEKQSEEKSKNLNDIVGNTQRLIQQMKEEINSDINSIDGRTLSHSEAESSSNEEQESSYSDTEDRSSDATMSDEKEITTSEDEDKPYSETEKQPTSMQHRTSSEDNDNFEEALDHVENQLEDFKHANIEMLDSIARSLQEEHTATVEIYHPKVQSVTKQDVNNNLFTAVNTFEEIYEELNNKTTDNNNIDKIQPESSNIIEENVVHYENIDLLAKQTINMSIFKTVAPNKLLIFETAQPIFNATIENLEEDKSNDIIEQYNNEQDTLNPQHDMQTIEFIETEVVVDRKQRSKSSSPQSNSEELKPDTEYLTNDTNINGSRSSSPLDITNQNEPEDYTIEENNTGANSVKNIPLDSNITTDTDNVDTVIENVEIEQPTVSNNINNIPDVNKSQSSTSNNLPPVVSIVNPTSNSGNNKISSNNRSNIPKLVKTANNKIKNDKNSPKLIVSKVPVRRASLKQYPAPAPPKSHFGNIQSGHVKQLQTRLFNSKVAPPKAISNSSETVEVKASTSTLNKKKQAPPPPLKQQTEKQNSAPSTSTPPNKKKQFFRETCRTEDEWTDSDSEDSQVQIIKPTEEPSYRPPSPPPPITVRRVSGQLIDLARVQLPEGSPERQARMLLAEGASETWEQAQIAVELISRGADPPDALLAALECADLPSALAYLYQDCELCASRLPEHEMVSMLRCTHRCCRECAYHYFTVQITERSIADCVCPYCKLPELESLPEDAWLEYFAHLDILLKTLLETDVHELFQRKLRDRTLARDPNFRWCMECSSGFFVHPKQKKIRCPECRSVSCASCRKTWSSNHEGLTCEQYTAWLEDNDPERSVTAIQQHLRDNGLECPRCHFKYSLSRGGCMHFTCTQCKYEFCYGCGKPFTMGARCGLSEYCAKLGLHAHHPRNCLFYLRDKEPHELQTLLQMNNVTYETEPSECSTARCPVQLQRETPTGLVDGTCGSETPANYAGLCKVHYVEYLAGLARGLDPIPIMDVAELVAELRRRALPLPERGPWDTDPIYAGMCAEIVKEKIPLD